MIRSVYRVVDQAPSPSRPVAERSTVTLVPQEDRFGFAPPSDHPEAYVRPTDRGRWRLATDAETGAPDRLEIVHTLASDNIHPDFCPVPGTDPGTARYNEIHGRLLSHSATQFRDGVAVLQTSETFHDGEWFLSMQAAPQAASHADRFPYPATAGPSPRDPHPADSIPLARAISLDRSKNESWHRSGLDGFMSSRYGHQRDLTVLELGPNLSTVVQRNVAPPDSGNHYIGLDHPSGMHLSREVLVAEDSRWNSSVTPVAGQWSAIPLKDSSVDLVAAFGGAYPRSNEEAVSQYHDEIARVLKPGGELITDFAPEEVAQLPPRAASHFLDHFTPVAWHKQSSFTAVVYRKD